MAKNTNATLDKDRVFDINNLNELLTQGKAILTEAISISQKMEKSITTISGVYNQIEKEQKTQELGTDIEKISGTLKKKIYQDTINTINTTLTKLIKDIPSYDTNLSQSVDSLREVLDTVIKKTNSLKGILETGDTKLSYKEYKKQLEEIKASWEATTEDLATILAEIEEDMLGTKAAAVQYSSDPVNLSTGNFVYDHEDMKIRGEIPISFHRYYNAKSSHKGSMGRCFLHNYEIKLEEKAEKITISMEDGQKKTFKKKENGTYQSQHTAIENLTKKDDTYILENQSEKKYIFDQAGKMIRQENRQKKGITYTYDEKGRLEKAETDHKEHLIYSYNKDNQINQVTDHTGRKVKLTYERGKLAAVENPQGSNYNYNYGKNGRIEETINPRGQVSVKNTYDEKRRIIKQVFPDGGHMEIEYDDPKRQVILTERNKSRITYIHDSKYRNTDIIYEDGTKEHFEYNEKSQRILHKDRNGNIRRMAYDNKGNITQIINPLGEKTSITYNANNQILTLKANGKEKLRNSYDSNGNLTTSIGADGKGNKITYNKQGRPVIIEKADKTKTEITYDEKGNIEKICETQDTQTSYKYDSLNRVISITDGNGNTTTMEYNQIDKIQTTINPLGAKRSYNYNESGKITKVIDYDGYIVKADYNEIGKIKEITDKEGNKTSFTYDKMWNTKQIKQADGGEIKNTYDKNNRIIQQQLPEEGSIEYTYDGNGNRTGITDATGNHIAYTYDELNRVVKITEETGEETTYIYDKEGNLTRIIDAAGNKTTYTYDEMNRCIKKTDAYENTTTYTYNAVGNIEKIQYPNGSKETRSYKGKKLTKIIRADGRKAEYEYDGNGNCISMINEKGEQITITYDALNRKQTITNPAGGTIEYKYDNLGNVTKLTDENKNETHYTYTPNGKLKTVTDAIGNKTKYTYSEMGYLEKIERNGENQAETQSGKEIQKTIYEWNQRGQVKSITDPLGAIETFEYDKSGRMIGKRDREGYHTAYKYGERGLLTDILYGDGTKVEYSYDALRRLKEIKDSTGKTQIETDALGRIIGVKDPQGKTVDYEWGSMNEKTQITYPDGKKAQYQYNEKGKLQTLTTEKGTIKYTYDELGRKKEKELPNGIKTQYSYNTTGHIETIHHEGKEIQEEYKYKYDKAGNKIQAIKKRQGMENDSGNFEYKYDAINRLIEVSREGNQLKKYTYDPYGNRTKKEEYRGEQLEQTTYQYNTNNQMISKKRGEEEHTYTYDYRGNLTAVSRGEEQIKTYEFDATNRMSRAMENIDGQEKRSEYRYNALGNRVGQDIYNIESKMSSIEPDMSNKEPLQETPQQQIYYILDLTRQYHNMLVLEDKVKEKEQTFYWDSNVVSMEEADRESYYIQDDLGSPMQLTDKNGEVREIYGYDEFGEEHNKTKKQKQPFGYTGYQKEETGELYYAQARRYDAGTGRFVSEDKVRGDKFIPDNINKYLYCLNQPLNYWDLSGLSREDVREYAEEYADDDTKERNPYFPYYEDGNCANFVSQCLLYAGVDPVIWEWYCTDPIYEDESTRKILKIGTGLKRLFDGKNVYYNDADPEHDVFLSDTWNTTPAQYEYFSDPDNVYINGDVIHVTTSEELEQVSGVQVGDLIYWDWYTDSDGIVNHASIVSKVDADGTIYYAANTMDRIEKSVSEALSKGDIYIVKLKDCVFD